MNYDEAVGKQVEGIQKEIAESCELVGKLEDISCLEREYASDDHVYQQKIQDLKSRYSKLRRTRGDGNCFFRAFGFAYMESLLKDGTDLERFKAAVVTVRDALLAVGYPSFTLEDFHDSFIDVLDSTMKPETTIESLEKTYRDQGMSDYVVCYLRIITSGHLQREAEFFQAFVDEGRTVKEYCSQEVEPMYRESDHLHISALTAALGVSVRVQYMDRGEGGVVNHHDFGGGGGGGAPRLHILYRPGHYDILYH